MEQMRLTAEEKINAVDQARMDAELKASDMMKKFDIMDSMICVFICCCFNSMIKMNSMTRKQNITAWIV